MGRSSKRIREKWRGVKASKGFHNALVFLVFLAVATLFWFILAMNDSVTRTFDVKLRIVNKPDSVTFITDPPQDIHVTLSDKGSNILRSGILQHPTVDINFRDFSNGSIFRFSKSDMTAALKATFGAGCQIGSVSLDSLYLTYTTGKGKRVPIIVRADLSASVGKVIAGRPRSMEGSVRVYSLSDEIDTITRVYTEPIIKRNLSESIEYTVKLMPIKGAKLVPSSVKVKVEVEPLVKKENMVQVKALNVPEGVSLVLFPPRVPVTYYVPMSEFNDDDVPLVVTVDYNDTGKSDLNRLPMTISSTGLHVANAQLEFESVEYTLVKE